MAALQLAKSRSQRQASPIEEKQHAVLTRVALLLSSEAELSAPKLGITALDDAQRKDAHRRTPAHGTRNESSSEATGSGLTTGTLAPGGP